MCSSAVCLKCLVSFETEAYVNSPTWTRWNGALAEEKQPLGSLAASDSGDDEGTKLLRAYLHQHQHHLVFSQYLVWTVVRMTTNFHNGLYLHQGEHCH